MQVPNQLAFAIAGPYGFKWAVHLKAQGKNIVLSKMTFSHQLIRCLLLVEQGIGFYNFKNEPDHHQ